MVIGESGISGDERTRRWPAVFSTKGIRASYVHKGQASKGFDATSKTFKYTIVFGQENMFDQEEASFNLLERVPNGTAHGGTQTELGITAHVQSTDYDYDDAATRATASRLAKLGQKESRKRSTSKTEVSSSKKRRTTNRKQQEAQQLKSEADSEASNEEDEEEVVQLQATVRLTRSGAKDTKATLPKPTREAKKSTWSLGVSNGHETPASPAKGPSTHNRKHA